MLPGHCENGDDDSQFVNRNNSYESIDEIKVFIKAQDNEHHNRNE